MLRKMLAHRKRSVNTMLVIIRIVIRGYTGGEESHGDPWIKISLVEPAWLFGNSFAVI